MGRLLSKTTWAKMSTPCFPQLGVLPFIFSGRLTIRAICRASTLRSNSKRSKTAKKIKQCKHLFIIIIKTYDKTHSLQAQYMISKIRNSSDFSLVLNCNKIWALEVLAFGMMISLTWISEFQQEITLSPTHLNGRGQTPKPDKTTLLGRARGNCRRQEDLHKHLSRLQPDYIK